MGTPTDHGYPAGGVVVQNTGSSTSMEIRVLDNSFLDVAPAFQVANALNDPNIFIAYNLVTQGTSCRHADQTNIYGSSGTAASPIEIYQNCIVANPDSDLLWSGECIQAGDGGAVKSTYVQVEQNTVLNGSASGISPYYNDQGTSSVINNIVVGLGPDNPENSDPDGIDMHGGGTASGNQVIFWDTYAKTIYDYNPASLSGQNGNVSLPPSDLTLAYEQTVFQNWVNLMAAEKHTIGRGGSYFPPVYPAPGDFPPNP